MSTHHCPVRILKQYVLCDIGRNSGIIACHPGGNAFVYLLMADGFVVSQPAMKIPQNDAHYIVKDGHFIAFPRSI